MTSPLRVAVVTGGGGAMGAACARVLGSSVDALLLTDVDGDRLASVVERIDAETPATVTSVVGDLGDAALVDELVGRARELGQLGALVHTAGLSPSMAGWEDILRVDLVATARLLDGFGPAVEPGSVAVCVASIAGHLGAFEPGTDEVLLGPYDAGFEARFRDLVGGEPDPGAAYRLAKRGVITLCERAAVTWGASGGRVVSVSPGLIDTAMGRLELDENPIKYWMAELTPVGGGRSDSVLPGLIDDIAAVVAFLCSDQAAFVSGCDIRVDGGLVGAMNDQGRAASVVESP
jgi:NAD(P)-dependent dehydrogenase (short-subunit alcohol dehydrogenase family)